MTKSIKKRLTALIMTLIMVFGLIPSVSTTAFAYVTGGTDRANAPTVTVGSTEVYTKVAPIFYKFIAPNTGTYTISTSDSVANPNTDTFSNIYEGENTKPLAEGVNDDYMGHVSYTASLTKDTVYYIEVQNCSADNLTCMLNISADAATVDFTGEITTSEEWTKPMSEIFSNITEGEDNVCFKNLEVKDGENANSAKVFVDSFDMGFDGSETSAANSQTVKFTASTAGIYSFDIYINSGTGITKKIQITVTGGNSSPTDISLSSSSIPAADTGSNSTVGTLSSTDANTADTFTYTLVSGEGDTDNASFNISENTLRTNNALSVGSYSIRVRTTDSGSLSCEKVLTITVTNAAAKTLTADNTNNNVDNDLDITFDTGFEGAITEVSYKGTVLTKTTDYVVTSGKITLQPSGGNSVLQTSGTGNVMIKATGYNDSTVSQTIEAGTVTNLEVTTQPVPGAASKDAFSTQPVVTLKDKYGNICSDGPSATANVVATAKAGTGSWTIGGLGTTMGASSGVATFADLTCTLTGPGTGAISFTSGLITIDSNLFTIPMESVKTLTADNTNNNVDNDIEITFTADAAFAGKITGVSYNGYNLDASQYIVDKTNNNKITLKPSADTGNATINAYLRTPSTGNVVIKATGYNDSTISQTIEAGAVASIEITTQPVVGTASKDKFSTQPIVTLKDKYGNICSDGPSATANVIATAKSGTGSWTIGGTTTKVASTGIVTFTDLTCTLTMPGTGAITFTSGLTTIDSDEFTIPMESAKTLTADTINNNVDNDIEITLIADASFVGKITGVSFNGYNLEASQYTVDKTNNDKIILKPSADTGDATKNAYLRTPSTGNVVIKATGYNDSTVEQKIEAGAVASIEVIAQPVPGTASKDAFSIQPAVKIKDKYGNICSDGPSSSANVIATAKSGTGSWTIGGTTKGASSGIVTFTDLTCTLTMPGTGAITFTSGLTAIDSNEFTIPMESAKTLTADTINNNVDNDIEITLTADANFAGKITGVSFNGHDLSASQYAVDTTNNNKIKLKPDADTGDATKNAYLRTPSTGNVVIKATGYNDSTISQKIEAGAVASIEITTQPVPGTASKDAFSTQPAVKIKDKYGNICSDGPSSTANVIATAKSGTGIWTIGGTTTKVASTGIVTFTDLTCTLTMPGNGVITFTSGLTTIDSNLFTIPMESAKTLTADTTNNNVDNDIEITFTADANFAGKITGISYNGHDLSASQYAVDTTNNNKIKLKPSADTGDATKNAYFRTPSTGNVVIKATGYNDSTVEQKIEAGSVASIEITKQPVPGTASKDAFSIQPIVTLKDKYGNICSDGPSSTANVIATAKSGTGIWTIGGTTTKVASTGIVTFTDLTCTLTMPGNGAITFTSGAVAKDSNEFTIPIESAKTLTADTTNNNVDNDIEISFTADANFAGKITGVSFNGHDLSASQYEVDTTNNNKITLKPSANTGDATKNAYLRTPSTGNVVITATGYNDSTVSQTINHGAAKIVGKIQDITAPATNGGQFATQPTFAIRDQYGNICTNDNSTIITASKKDAGTWTLTGTVAKTAISGVVTFTDLGATNTAQIENAQIAFNAAGLTGATSNAVTLPSPPKSNNNNPVVVPPTQPTGVDILVNGKVETAATSTTTKIENKTVETVTLDSNKIEEKLQQEGNKSVVTIPAQKSSDVVIGQLNGQTVKNMENKEAVLEIKIANINYTLPATEINIDNISSQIGKQVELKDILVNVKISTPVENTVKIIEDTANKNNYQVVVKPVDFEITCTNGNKTVEVAKFNSYVERMIAIPEGIDPSKITTGIVLNNDGTFTHVPTVITIINGKYYAKINSLTNSTYSVIWSPRTFEDVANHWAKEAVNDMGSRLVIKGVGLNNFEPDRDITRAEYAAIVVNGLGLMRPGTGKDVFNDVAKTSWYYDAVYIANEYGLISGYGNKEFRPNDKITREQAMAIISRAMKVTKLNAALTTDEADKLLTTYNDSVQISAWAKESIAGCIQSGIVTGKNNQMLAPKDKITRAEVAAIIRRLLQKSKLI